MNELLQDETEIAALAELFASEGVLSYLEIGSKFGGSLGRVARALPKGSRIVAVDLPGGTKAWAQSGAALKNLIRELCAEGYDARVIWGDSQSVDVIAQVRALAPFDAILLDADHRMAGVTADWNNYGTMSTSMVAFHDITWRRAPEWQGVRIDVPEFWHSIKLRYRHREIKECPTGKNNGIGVLWKISQL